MISTCQTFHAPGLGSQAQRDRKFIDLVKQMENEFNLCEDESMVLHPDGYQSMIRYGVEHFLRSKDADQVESPQIYFQEVYQFY